MPLYFAIECCLSYGFTHKKWILFVMCNTSRDCWLLLYSWYVYMSSVLGWGIIAFCVRFNSIWLMLFKGRIIRFSSKRRVGNFVWLNFYIVFLCDYSIDKKVFFSKNNREWDQCHLVQMTHFQSNCLVLVDEINTWINNGL